MNFLILLFGMVQELHHGPQFPTEIQRRKHAAPNVMHKSTQELNCEVSLQQTRA
jgi:hypothetical protein